MFLPEPWNWQHVVHSAYANIFNLRTSTELKHIYAHMYMQDRPCTFMHMVVLRELGPGV